MVQDPDQKAINLKFDHYKYSSREHRPSRIKAHQGLKMSNILSSGESTENITKSRALKVIIKVIGLRWRSHHRYDPPRAKEKLSEFLIAKLYTHYIQFPLLSTTHVLIFKSSITLIFHS